MKDDKIEILVPIPTVTFDLKFLEILISQYAFDKYHGKLNEKIECSRGTSCHLKPSYLLVTEVSVMNAVNIKDFEIIKTPGHISIPEGHLILYTKGARKVIYPDFNI